ncbi:MAG: hypothetical protein U0K91_11615, partial [Acutalibacteraceae bacterium]|nr:hypothetical protein [Acutalibacteraceae bacterium]
MSELNRDELRSLLEGIREERLMKGVDENGEPARIWSNEDIDRLLGIAEEMQSEAGAQETENAYTKTVEIPVIEEEEDEEPFFEEDIKVVDISESNEPAENKDRLRSIFNDEAAPIKKIKSLKKKVAKKTGPKKSFLEKGKEFLDSLKSTQKQENQSLFLDDELDEFEEDEFDVNEDYMNDEDYNGETIRIGDLSEFETDVDGADGKTKAISFEKPGRVIRKGISKDDSDLEGAPTIVSVEEEFDENSPYNEDFKKQIREEEESGQIKMEGFVDVDQHEKPEKIEESEAEKELFKK